MQSTLSILKWAAGCPAELPAGGDVCEADLITLLVKHRLVERFLARLDRRDERSVFASGRPAWCSPALIANLVMRSVQARVKFWRHCEAVHEIVNALDRRRQSPFLWPVVMFKGCTTFALTGEPRHLHDSGDVDLLCDDPDAFQSVARELGYSVVEHDRYRHELATFTRGGILIELHRYIEVVSYPGDARADAEAGAGQPASPGRCGYVPRENPGCWWQRAAFVRRNPSMYEQIAGHCTAGAAPGTVGLGFANATLSVVILCAHALMDYVYPCELCALPVRLGELADIRDLCRLDSFDLILLQELIGRMDARDSIDFAGHLIGEHFGVDPLGGAGPGAFWYPRMVTYDGGWACVSTADDVLIPLDARTVIDRLEANVLSTSGGPIRVSAGVAPPAGAYQGEGRTIVCSVLGRPIQVAVTAEWRDGDLVIDILVDDVGAPALVVSLHGAVDEIGAAVSLHLDTRYTAHSYSERVIICAVMDGHGGRVSFGLPRAALREAVGNPPYHFLVSVEQWEAGIPIRSCRPDPCVLVPIKAEASE